MLGKVYIRVRQLGGWEGFIPRPGPVSRAGGCWLVNQGNVVGAVRRLYERALLPEHAQCVDIGDPDRIGPRDLDLNFSREARAAVADAPLMPQHMKDRHMTDRSSSLSVGFLPYAAATS